MFVERGEFGNMILAVGMLGVLIMMIVKLLIFHARDERGDAPDGGEEDHPDDGDDLWYSNVKVKESYLRECGVIDDDGSDENDTADEAGLGNDDPGERR